MKAYKGLTLLEVIYGIAITSILATVAFPALGTLQKRSSNHEATSQLINTLLHARSTAVHSRSVVTICAGLDRCSSEQTWHSNALSFIDTNRNGQLDGAEQILHSSRIKDGHFWHWNNFRRTPYIQYQPDGSTLGQNGTFTLCSNDLRSSHQVLVNVIGRSRVREQQMDAVCTDAALRR